ncbi:MAG: histidine phosphatase family protein [Planctomycetota bacterium]
MPDHLIVIRSAPTDYEVQGRVRGSLDVPPCPAGLAEAGSLATRLAATPLAGVYAAPSTCALETARIVAAAHGLQPRSVELLANLDLGLWQGKLVAEVRRQQPRVYRQWQDDPWSVVAPEGETLEEARGRVEKALERIFKRHREGRVAVVVPAPLDALVRWLVSGEPLGDLWLPDPQRVAAVELPVAAQWQPGGVAPTPPLGDATSAVPVGLSAR